MNSPFFSLHPLSTTMWLVLSLSFSINCVCAMQILVSQNVPVWYHRYLTYTSAHYWEQMTQWTKLRNFLGTCVIYNSGICSVILLYAWPEAVVGILKVVYFYVNIPLSWLHMNYVLRKRLGHMGNSEFLITAFKESVANAFGVSICLKEPIFRGLRGDGCHIT